MIAADQNKKYDARQPVRDVVLFVSRDKGWKTEMPLRKVGLSSKVFYTTGSVKERLQQYWSLVSYVYRTKNVGIITDTTQFAAIPVLLAKILGANYVVRLRGDSLTETRDSWKIMIYPLEKYVTLKFATGIIPVSDYLKDTLSIAYPNKLIEIVRTPVVPDREEFTKPAECKTILVAMNFSFKRKVGRFIKDLPTIDRILSQVPWVSLRIIGDGRLRRSVEEAVDRAKNRDKILLAGAKKSIWPWLNEALCLLHPSELDAYPSVIAEAQMAGRPVVAYDACGMREMVNDGIDGFLYTNDSELESKLKELMVSPVLIEKFGIAGKKKATESNMIEVVGESMGRAINKMLLQENGACNECWLG